MHEHLFHRKDAKCAKKLINKKHLNSFAFFAPLRCVYFFMSYHHLTHQDQVVAVYQLRFIDIAQDFFDAMAGLPDDPA